MLNRLIVERGEPLDGSRMSESKNCSLKDITVTIGVPVYNGERYLAEAIDSLLTQTHERLEIIIADNASSDGTEKIGRSCAERDKRVRYIRNESNIGAAPNFNKIVDVASGKYFKWAAHDDLCDPLFVERSLAAIEAGDDIVLSYPKSQLIDAEGKLLEVYDKKLPTDSSSPSVRFESLLRGHACYEIFGLIRTNVLRKTDLIGCFAHGDGVLLGQLALRGRFVEVDEALFFPRKHEGQSMTLLRDSENAFKPDYRAYAVWFNSRLDGKLVFPWWRMYWEFLWASVVARIGLWQKIRCWKHWLTWAWVRRAALIEDILFPMRRFFGKSAAGEEVAPS